MSDPLSSTFDPVGVPAIPEPPLPLDPSSLWRWRHNRLRRRMLTGVWDGDLREIVQLAAGTKRREAWKMVDLSANFFRSSMHQLSVQYDRKPFVLHPAKKGQKLAQIAAKAGYWRKMKRNQRNTLGLREMLVRIDVPASTRRPVYRPVYPDFVVAEASLDQPDQPALLCEAVLRERHVKGTRKVAAHLESCWTWETWDIRDPSNPRVQVVDERGRDVSKEFLKRADGSPAPDGGLTGDDYTWRFLTDTGEEEAGAPFLPYVLYHAADTGQLWDPYEMRELVAGSLNVALMWSFFGHVLRNTAWAQKYGLGVRPIGTEQVGEGDAQRQVHRMDPAVLALFEADGETGQPLLGQFAIPVDPLVMAESIALYCRMLAASTGILAPVDVMRVAGDPRSGFAIALSREGQREAQVQFEPQFEVGDLRALSITGSLMTRASGDSYPEDDYGIVYQTVPLSVEEKRAQREHVLELLDRGLIDKVQAYQIFNPGASDEQAVVALDRIRQINAQFDDAPKKPTPDPEQEDDENAA